jgi:signal transduction histidine kinase
MGTMQTAAKATAPGPAQPAPGPDAARTQSVLSRFEHHQRRIGAFDRRRPWVLDTLLVLFVIGISVRDLREGGGRSPFGISDAREQLPTFVPHLLAVATIVPLWFRRKAPVVVFFVIAAIVFAQWSLNLWQPAGVCVLIALYTLASRGPLRALWWALALAVVEVTLAVWVLSDATSPVQGMFFLLGTVTAATALGLTVRTRRMYVASLEDRAHRLEVERDQRERLTAAAERTRVAREMHDILGHNLSVMVSLADGAATLAANRNESSTEALRILADTGRQAMGELRRVLGVLREEERDPRSLSPQPGIGDLDALLARVRAAGLPVAYRTSGDLDGLGDGMQLAVYRIVQEALTNTLKHAGPGATAEVALANEAGRVQVRIADTGTTDTARSPEGPGHGIVGIRQRAALYGGDVHIGPRENGPGWIVDAELEAPAQPGDPA